MNTHNFRCHVLMAILFSIFFLQNSKASSEFCTPSCSGQVNLSLPQSGFAVITPDFILSGSNNCTGNWTVTVTDPNDNVLPGNVVNCAYLGLTLMVSVKDIDTGVSCWGNLLVEDKMPPTLACADVTISCSESTDPSNTGMPTVTDNCFGTPTLTHTDVPIIHNCADPLYDVTIERTWTATDVSGNSISCTQNIFLEKALLTNVVFPPNATVDCSNPDLEPSNTGEPTVSGASFDGFCNLKFGYTDGSQIPSCPGGYIFIRSWSVVDCCSNEVLTGTQKIEVADTTPPTISCPADQTVSVTSTSCTANLILDLATATDDCSTPTITFSSTSGVISGNNITGLTEGMHTVQYIATDGCGNMDTCEMKITVVDNIAPIAICMPKVVALGDDGCAIVSDTAFVGDSFDNCCIDTFFVRIMGDPDFGHFVKFDCDDIGDTVFVEFKIVDKSGNENSCMTSVMVQDKIAPTIVCPDDKTIDCTDYPLDESQLGNAFASDGCGIDTLFFADNESGLDDCTKVGTILRTWTVIDLQGLVTTCVQTITLQDSGSAPVFNIPPNITIDCGTTIDLSTTGEGTISNPGCVNYIALVSDSLDFTTDVCNKKMIRTWTFVNYCTNEIVHQGDQLIIEIDTVAPIITCPNDTILFDRPSAGSQVLDCQQLAFPGVFDASAVDACSGIASFSNDAPDPFFGTNSFSAAGSFPLGDTDVTFTATDSCNNTATCTATITVIDDIHPTVTCGAMFIFPTQTNPVTINGDSLLVYLDIMDDCSNPTSMILDSVDFPLSVYSCDDLPGQGGCIRDTVHIIVSDALGNSISCSPELFVCSESCLFALTFIGITHTEEMEMVKKFEVAVMDENNIETMINSEELGYYVFGVNSSGGDYSFAPKKNDDFLNGVTTFDLVKIRRHILGSTLLNSPYKMIAADANRDNKITTFDLVSIKQLILQNWDELPNNTSWRFIDAKHLFSDWADPFVDDFPEQIECLNLTSHMNSQNFIAIKIGDVTNNASPDNLIASDTRGTDIVQFNTDDILLEKEEIYQIPIYAKDIQQLEGFQFTLDVNTALVEFLEIEKGLLEDDDFGFRFMEEGLITASWVNSENQELDENSVLFFVKLKAKENTVLHQVLSIHSQKTKALAYDQSENVSGIELFFNDKKESLVDEKSEFILYQNQPNPFSESTEIRFYLPENSDVELQIVDVSGKTIQTFSNHYLLGEHKIELKSSVFPSGGVYIYKLITPSFSASKKMTMIK